MSSLIKEAFQQLYPEKELRYSISLKYSRKFKPYNANVKRYGNNLIFNLSRDWKKSAKKYKLGCFRNY